MEKEATSIPSGALDHLTKPEKQALLDRWLLQARQHRAEAWMNWQLADAHVKRLEAEIP